MTAMWGEHMSGAHLEQLAPNHWSLTGIDGRVLDIERKEIGARARWIVEHEGEECGAWCNCALALAQAFSLVTTNKNPG